MTLARNAAFLIFKRDPLLEMAENRLYRAMMGSATLSHFPRASSRSLLPATWQVRSAPFRQPGHRALKGMAVQVHHGRQQDIDTLTLRHCSDLNTGDPAPIQPDQDIAGPSRRKQGGFGKDHSGPH